MRLYNLKELNIYMNAAKLMKNLNLLACAFVFSVFQWLCYRAELTRDNVFSLKESVKLAHESAYQYYILIFFSY